MAFGSITIAEYRLLIQETGTRKYACLPANSRSLNTEESDFVGAYAGSSKEPDFSISHQHLNFPHLVVESGWSESFPRLRNDKNLWINGGGGKVRVVLLFKWSARLNNRVAGVIEVWVGDAAGNDSLAQTEVMLTFHAFRVLFDKLATDRCRIYSPRLLPISLRHKQFELPEASSSEMFYTRGEIPMRYWTSQ